MKIAFWRKNKKTVTSNLKKNTGMLRCIARVLEPRGLYKCACCSWSWRVCVCVFSCHVAVYSRFLSACL